MTVPLVLKKITDDLTYLKNSLDIVRYKIEENIYQITEDIYLMVFRTKAQYMATQYLSSAMQKIEDNLYDEVGLLSLVNMF